MTLSGICYECNNVLSDPACVNCYMREINVWLNEQNISPGRENEFLSEIEETLLSKNYNQQLCILCKDRSSALCSYCFFLNVHKILKRQRLSPEQIESFEQSFNYNLPSQKHINLQHKKLININ